jgi:hypothetical protein
MKSSHVLMAGVLAAAIVGGLAAIDQAAAQESGKTRPVVEFQRAADAYAFVHRQVAGRIGLANRNGADPVEVVVAG